MNTIMLHEQELITKEHIRSNTYKFNTPVKQAYIWYFISKVSVTVRAAERGGGATGAICPGPHPVGGPILTNSTSIKQNAFSIHS